MSKEATSAIFDFTNLMDSWGRNILSSPRRSDFSPSPGGAYSRLGFARMDLLFLVSCFLVSSFPAILSTRECSKYRFCL
jgi:hypothetical protein